jgi:hypothetical protein
MSGPIIRKYGFPNFEKIFGERPLEHGADEAESEAAPAEKPEASKPKANKPDTETKKSARGKRKPE